MKILIVDRYFYPDLQATAVLLTDLANELAKDNQVEVLCGPPSRFREFADGFKPNAGLKITTLPAFEFNQFSMARRFLNYSSFLLTSFAAVLFHPKVDVVMAQSSPPLLHFFISIACRVRGLRFIYVCQDLFPQTAIASGYLQSPLLKQIFGWMHRSGAHLAHRVVAIGRDMKNALLNEGVQDKKISIIANWANLDELKVFPKENAFSKSHGLTGHFIVMHSGNFGLVQDFDFILRIAEQLKSEKNVRMVFVGGGALKSMITRQANEKRLHNVLFIDFQDRGMIPEVLASADLHLVSLKKRLAGYSVPSKVYSLLASGRPILGLIEKHSEAALLIKEADCGFVVDSFSPEEVARSIRDIAKQPEQLQAWGKNARSFAEKSDFRKNALEQYKLLMLETAK